MRELLIGCGANLEKQMWHQSKEWSGLVTLDVNPDHHPDVLWDLNEQPLPFETSEFNELHAYQVLEHLGRQGDWRGFFEEFSEYWRILKPGGVMFAHVPMWTSEWAWGDPSHTRVITPGTLSFLSQKQYRQQIGKTAMSDYRNVYKADFEILHSSQGDGRTTVADYFYFALRALK